jgi:hypothetical protein
MISNSSKKKVLAKECKECKSISSKAIGLMFSFPIKNKGLIFFFEKEKRIDLHMFFVFYPIDLIFLDRKKKIIELKEKFMPFTFYISKKKAKYLLELPVKTIKKSNSKIGDKIKW